MTTPFGRYELLERIGLGGMAEVWRARVSGVGGFEKIVVIKKILPSFAQNKTFIDMLLAEAKLCAMLQHANIVQVYENGENDGIFYIAMEYVAGHDLFKVLSRSTQSQIRIPPEVCLYIAAEAAKGLHYAHNARDNYGRPLHIIHRDVSPSNIILSESGEVKVMDFGVARATPGGQRENATRSGVLKGKLGYMSPEQVTGRNFNHRSDIFSLGIILYESLTLKRLFLAKTDLETLVNIRDARLEHKFKKHSYIDEDFRGVLRKSLAREPESRYPSALAMHDDIQQVLFDRRQHISGSAVARFLAELFDPTKSAMGTPPPISPMAVPDEPASSQKYDPAASSRVSGPVALPPTQPALNAPALLQQAVATGERGLVPPPTVAKPATPSLHPASNSLSFSPAEMVKMRDSIAQKRAEAGSVGGDDWLPTADGAKKAALNETQQQPRPQLQSVKGLVEPPPLKVGIPPQPTTQPVFGEAQAKSKTQRATDQVSPPAESLPVVPQPVVPQLGKAISLAREVPARPVSPNPSFQVGPGRPVTGEMALFDDDLGLQSGSHAPITDPGMGPMDDQPGSADLAGTARGQSAVSGVILPRAAAKAAGDQAAALAPSAPNAVVGDNNPPLGAKSTSSPALAQRQVTPTAFPMPGAFGFGQSGKPAVTPVAAAISDSLKALVAGSEVSRPQFEIPEPSRPPFEIHEPTRPPFEIMEPSRPPFAQPEPSQRIAAVAVENSRTRAANERTVNFDNNTGPPSDVVDGAVLTDRGTQTTFDGRSDGQSYSVASSARGSPVRPTYRLRLADGTELGPMTLTNLESLLKARSASVEDFVAVGETSFQPIRSITALTTLVAAITELRPAPTISGPLSQWVFVRLVYKAAADRSTGVLELRRGDAVKSIYFRRGRTQYIASNQHQELLGPFMVANNYITQSDVDMAIARSKQTGSKLGDLMISMNFIKPFQLYQILERQLRAKFIDAFGWDNGTFAFYDNIESPADIVPLDFDPISVLSEGVRERVPLAVLEPLFADKLDRPLHKVRNPTINLAALKLPSRESKMVTLLHSVQTPRQAYEECYNNRQQRLALLHVLFLMLQTELVTFDADRT